MEYKNQVQKENIIDKNKLKNVKRKIKCFKINNKNRGYLNINKNKE